MMAWTDRHCRYFHRLLAPEALLYTEMVHSGAILHGDFLRHLRFDPAEHPVALQLGGSEPGDLAAAARIGHQLGYDEINLNCGCPSDRVQRGRFGACLMAEPARVAACVAAVAAAVPVPVTVKCRIGIDANEEFGFLSAFVETVAAAGCRTFVVHARNAWLKGLSPKENREVPPLRHEVVWRLKREFPGLEVVLNGGLRSLAAAQAQLAHVDGVMIGREAYENPWSLDRPPGSTPGPRSGGCVADGGGRRHGRLCRGANERRRTPARDLPAHARPVQRPARRKGLAPPSRRRRSRRRARAVAAGRSRGRADARRSSHVTGSGGLTVR